MTEQINAFINPPYIATTTVPIISSIRNTKKNITLNFLIIPPYFPNLYFRQLLF